MSATYSRWSSRNARNASRRSPSSSSRASRADSRSPMPNGADGESRRFSAGANRWTLALTASQPSAGWMFVQYVRWKNPLGSICTRAFLSRPAPARVLRPLPDFEFRRLAQETYGVVEDDLFDERFRMMAAPHLHGEARNRDGIARTPVARSCHADALGAVLLDDVHGALGGNLRLRIERQTCPEPVVENHLDRVFLGVIDDHARGLDLAVAAEHIDGDAGPFVACLRDAACESGSAGGARSPARPAPCRCRSRCA